MFYQEYLVKRRMMDKLTHRLKQKRKLLNKPVTIKNLVVFPEDVSPAGESNFTAWANINMVQRIIDQVESLSQIANLYHQQAYCEPISEEKYQLKEKYNNTITRLSLSEFSFYGKRPLTMSEFTQVITAVTNLAKKNHDNVHLLLSSFSVINEKQRILNISLYVQGGEEPKIDVISKATASDIDVEYPNSIRFSQRYIGRSTKKVSPFIADDNKNESTISNNSIFRVTAKGGGTFLQTIDVCLDHLNLHSKKLLEAQLQLNDIDSSDFIPEQMDQIVTSNSVEIEKKAKLGPSVLHIDPAPQTYFDRENKNRPIDKKSTLSKKCINSILHYSETEIISGPGVLIVTKPPFGPDYRVVIYDEQQVGSYNPKIKALVKAVNDQIIDKQVKRLLNESSSRNLKDMETIDSTSEKVYSLAYLLVEQLIEECKPTITDSEDYFLKLIVTAGIDESAKNLINFEDDGNQYLFLAEASSWAEKLKSSWNNLTNIPNEYNALFQKLDALVDNFQDVVENERPADTPKPR